MHRDDADANADVAYGFFDVNTHQVLLSGPKCEWATRTVKEETKGLVIRTQIFPSGEDGMFLLLGNGGVSLWDFENCRKVRNICKESGFRRAFVSDGDLFLLHQRDMSVYRQFMKM
jgi:hypothetical protein